LSPLAKVSDYLGCILFSCFSCDAFAFILFGAHVRVTSISLIGRKESELGSLFSSPAFGSFASPKFHSKAGNSTGFQLSGSDSDDGCSEFEDDEQLFSGKRDAGRWKQDVDSFSLDESRGNTQEDDSGIFDSAESPRLQHQHQHQHQQQRLLLRFSCADSLDRTNLASFFVALQFVGPCPSFVTFCFPFWNHHSS
jgi:hypothetical protein